MLVRALWCLAIVNGILPFFIFSLICKKFCFNQLYFFLQALLARERARAEFQDWEKKEEEVWYWIAINSVSPRLFLFSKNFDFLLQGFVAIIALSSFSSGNW